MDSDGEGSPGRSASVTGEEVGQPRAGEPPKRRAESNGEPQKRRAESNGEPQERRAESNIVGAVTEILPSGLYRVRLEQGSVVMAHIADRMDRNFVRILVGDRVRLELSPLDAGRGRIVEKI
jgi:translation initiation factor IF-1